MDKLLELVQEKAGISADQAQKAIEAVVGFMKDKLPGPIGDQLSKLVDGGDDEGGGDDRPRGRARGGRGGRDRDPGGRGGRDRGGRGGRDRDRDRDRGDRGSSRGDSDSESSSSGSDRVEVSFEDKFEAGLEDDLGDLGPSSGSRRRS